MLPDGVAACSSFAASKPVLYEIILAARWRHLEVESDLGGPYGRVHSLHVGAIIHALHMPAVGFEAGRAVFGEGQVGGTVAEPTGE